jgi:DNA-binding NarL/FixJ family response regulator
LKVIPLTLWARNSHIEVAVRHLLRSLPAIRLVESVSTAADSIPTTPAICPNPITIIVLARNAFKEAFLREQLHTITGLTCISKQQNNPDAVLMEHPLLTWGEQRVLRACALHDDLAEIANYLCIAEATVKKHLGRIYSRFGRHSLHRVLLCAVQWGLITLSEEVQCP